MLPLRTEVVTLKELNESEGKEPDGEVKAVGRELATGEVIKAVVVLEFTDHLLEQSSLFVEVDDGLSILFFLGDVGGNNPVVLVPLEEIALVATPGTFDNQAKGFTAVAEGIVGLGNVVIGS